MLYLKDERWCRLATSIGHRRDTPKLWEVAQVFEQCFVFGHVRNRLCIVVEVAHKAMR